MSGSAFGPSVPGPDDPWQHPDTIDYARRWTRDVLPRLRRSATSVSIIGEHDELDVQQATELGATLLLEKPLILAVSPGVRVPDGLAAAAAAIVELDPHDMPGSSSRMAETIKRLGLA